MWLAHLLGPISPGLVLAKDSPPSPAWTIASTILVGFMSLLAAVLAAWFSLRGAKTTADTQRETAFDARVDKELDRLRAERDTAEERERLAGEREEVARQALSQVREAYTQLRIAVRSEGFDPDELVRRHGQRPQS